MADADEALKNFELKVRLLAGMVNALYDENVNVAKGATLPSWLYHRFEEDENGSLAFRHFREKFKNEPYKLFKLTVLQETPFQNLKLLRYSSSSEQPLDINDIVPVSNIEGLTITRDSEAKNASLLNITLSEKNEKQFIKIDKNVSKAAEMQLYKIKHNYVLPPFIDKTKFLEIAKRCIQIKYFPGEINMFSVKKNKTDDEWSENCASLVYTAVGINDLQFEDDEEPADAVDETESVLNIISNYLIKDTFKVSAEAVPAVDRNDDEHDVADYDDYSHDNPAGDEHMESESKSGDYVMENNGFHVYKNTNAKIKSVGQMTSEAYAANAAVNDVDLEYFMITTTDNTKHFTLSQLYPACLQIWDIKNDKISALKSKYDSGLKHENTRLLDSVLEQHETELHKSNPQFSKSVGTSYLLTKRLLTTNFLSIPKHGIYGSTLNFCVLNKKNNTLCGFVIGTALQTTAKVKYFYLDVICAQKGNQYGSKLLDKVKNFLKQHNFDAIYANTINKLTNASFFCKNGFQKLKEPKKFGSDFEHKTELIHGNIIKLDLKKPSSVKDCKAIVDGLEVGANDAIITFFENSWLEYKIPSFSVSNIYYYGIYCPFILKDKVISLYQMTTSCTLVGNPDKSWWDAHTAARVTKDFKAAKTIDAFEVIGQENLFLMKKPENDPLNEVNVICVQTKLKIRNDTTEVRICVAKTRIEENQPLVFENYLGPSGEKDFTKHCVDALQQEFLKLDHGTEERVGYYKETLNKKNELAYTISERVPKYDLVQTALLTCYSKAEMSEEAKAELKYPYGRESRKTELLPLTNVVPYDYILKRRTITVDDAEESSNASPYPGLGIFGSVLIFERESTFSCGSLYRVGLDRVIFVLDIICASGNKGTGTALLCDIEYFLFINGVYGIVVWPANKNSTQFYVNSGYKPLKIDDFRTRLRKVIFMENDLNKTYLMKRFVNDDIDISLLDQRFMTPKETKTFFDNGTIPFTPEPDFTGTKYEIKRKANKILYYNSGTNADKLDAERVELGYRYRDSIETKWWQEYKAERVSNDKAKKKISENEIISFDEEGIRYATSVIKTNAKITSDNSALVSESRATASAAAE